MAKTKKAFSAKRVLALALALIMALSVMPAAFAADDVLDQQGKLTSVSGGWRTGAWYVNVFFSTDLSSRGDGLDENGSLNYTYVQMQDNDVVDLTFAFGMQKNAGTNYGRLESISTSGLPASITWKNVEGNVGDTPWPCNMPGSLLNNPTFLKLSLIHI